MAGFIGNYVNAWEILMSVSIVLLADSVSFGYRDQCRDVLSEFNDLPNIRKGISCLRL